MCEQRDAANTESSFVSVTTAGHDLKLAVVAYTWLFLLVIYDNTHNNIQISWIELVLKLRQRAPYTLLARYHFIYIY